MNMITKYQQFSVFIESLKRAENASLIEAIQTGINAVMEAGFQEDDIGAAAVRKGRNELRDMSSELRDVVNTIANKIYEKFGEDGMFDIANVLSNSQIGPNPYKPTTLSAGEVEAIKTSILGRTLPFLDSTGLTPESFLRKFANSALEWDPESGSTFADFMSGAGMHLQKEGGRDVRGLTNIKAKPGSDEEGETEEDILDSMAGDGPLMQGKPLQHKDLDKAEESTAQEMARAKYLPKILQGIKQSLKLSDEGLTAVTAQLQKAAQNATDELSRDDYEVKRKQLDNLRTARKRTISKLQTSLAEKDVMQLVKAKQELDEFTQELEALKSSKLQSIGSASKEAGMNQGTVLNRARQVPEIAKDEYMDEYEEMGFAGSEIEDPFQKMQNGRSGGGTAFTGRTNRWDADANRKAEEAKRDARSSLGIPQRT